LNAGADSSGFLSQIENAVYVDHPFNALTVLTTDIAFDVPATMKWPPRLPYYDDGAVSGVRVDSKDHAVSLYLLTGSNEAIRAIHDELTPHRWAAMKSSFNTRPVSLASFETEMSAATDLDLNADHAYGTQLFTPGLGHHARQTLLLRVSRWQATLEVVDGVAGRTPLPPTLTVAADQVPVVRPLVALGIPLFYVIEDNATQAILVVGARLAERCVYGRATCDR
jgi:serine protease inhibitor